MKRAFFFLIICLAASAIIIGSIPKTSNAWKPKLPIGGGDKKQDEGAPVSLEDIKSEDKSIRLLVANATSSFLKGSSNVFAAVDDKASAEKYLRASEDLLKTPEDPQKIKDSMMLVDEANNLLNEIPEKQTELSAKSKQLLGKGIMYVGAGGLLNTKAGDKSADFLDKLKRAMDSVKANPTKYGLGATSRLKKSFHLMTFLSSNLPKQGATIGKTFANLVKYANANGVSVSESDAERIAANMEKG
jgi:hypothetical protein